jgi:hypothetical protein
MYKMIALHPVHGIESSSCLRIRADAKVSKGSHPVRPDSIIEDGVHRI